MCKTHFAICKIYFSIKVVINKNHYMGIVYLCLHIFVDNVYQN